MSQESVERFLGRILTDDLFRRMAAGSLRMAAAAEDFTFTNDEAESLAAIDWNGVELVSRELNRAIKRSSPPEKSTKSIEDGAVWAVLESMREMIKVN